MDFADGQAAGHLQSQLRTGTLSFGTSDQRSSEELAAIQILLPTTVGIVRTHYLTVLYHHATLLSKDILP